MCVIFQPSWVRKFIGKPAFLTIADCEFKARRIQNAVQDHADVFSFFAMKSNAFRTHSEVIRFADRSNIDGARITITHFKVDPDRRSSQVTRLWS